MVDGNATAADKAKAKQAIDAARARGGIAAAAPVRLAAAAAPRESQLFALVGAACIIPVILAYTAWAYYVFRGKVTGEEGYH